MIPPTTSRVVAVSCDECGGSMTYTMEYLTAELRRWTLACPAGCSRTSGREQLAPWAGIACRPNGLTSTLSGRLWGPELDPR